MAETTTHQLESKSDVAIEVLIKYDSLAQRLITGLLCNEDLDLIGEFPFLNDHPGSLAAVAGLSGQKHEHNSRQLMLKDRLYLNVCIYGAEKEGETAIRTDLATVLSEL